MSDHKMSMSGQNNFKGLNTQAKASLLLFLMNFRNSDFDSVTLEDKDWEDFTLNFKSGKKIICESKDRKNTLSWWLVKGILDNILGRKLPVNKDDRILIVCRSVSADLEKNIKYLKYNHPQIINLYKEHDFTDEQLGLLAKTSFFKIEQGSGVSGPDDYLYQEALTYFNDQISYWIPAKELEMFMDYVLVRNVYFKSEQGATFTKDSLNQEIEDYKKNKIKGSYAYDPEKRSIEEQLGTIISSLQKPNQRDRILNESALIAITSQPELAFYLLDVIKRSLGIIQLQDLDLFWKAAVKRLYAFSMLLIFEKNLENQENAEYAVRFLTDNYKHLDSPVRDTSNQELAVEMITKIVGKHHNFVDLVFRFIKEVLTLRSGTYKTLEFRTDFDRERALVAKLLHKNFEIYQSNEEWNTVREILNLIVAHFDLVSDDGEHSLYTPSEIFWILQDYIYLDFEKHFLEIVKIVVDQFNSHRYYNGRFEGWELAGGGVAYVGKSFSLVDRHFVEKTLKPAINKYHAEKSEEAWEFIITNCITRDEGEVEADKPDFLNRAVIDVLLKEYAKENGKHNEEAKNMLQDFIHMRKGIPHKAELIYQSVRNSKELTDKQKWELVRLQLDYKPYKGLPANVFVEQIVFELASGQNKVIVDEVSEILFGWIDNPEYDVRHMTGSYDITDGILKLLENKDTFDKGVELFEKYLSGPEMTDKNKTDTWNTYDVAQTLVKVLVTKPDKGLEILEGLYNYPELTTNQQIVITSTLGKLPVDKKRLLKNTFDNFVRPKFENLLGISLDEIKKIDALENIAPIESKFSHRYARNSLVDFADNLAKAEFFEEALQLVKVLIKDSDPPRDGSNYPDDPKGDFNYHKIVKEGSDSITISTVRGRCAWVLQKFVTVKGRKFIGDIVPLVRKLIQDPNFYVRVQACVPLIELVKSRHAVMPNTKERFLSRKVAADIESVAFDMLENRENHKLPAVMKNLAMAFTHMRIVPESLAKDIVDTFLDADLPKEPSDDNKESAYDMVIGEFSPLLIHLAEFRNRRVKDQDWSYLFGEKMWGELQEFDDNWFKQKLENLLETGSPQTKHNLAWRFWRLPQERGVDYDEVFPISYYYLSKLTSIYDRQLFGQLYHFVDENIDRRFDECFELWTKCLKVERPEIERLTNAGEVREVYWWPHHWNGKILLEVSEKRGEADFFEWFNFLLDYPKEVSIAGDLDKVVERLVSFPTDHEDVKRVFGKLIERNPKYFDFKQQWLEKGG